jgi:hypothetical protein
VVDVDRRAVATDQAQLPDSWVILSVLARLHSLLLVARTLPSRSALAIGLGKDGPMRYSGVYDLSGNVWNGRTRAWAQAHHSGVTSAAALSTAMPAI